MPGLARSADELTLIVSRGEDSATYYLSMPADEIEPILGTDPALLFSDDGRVPIEDFRYAGSFDLADEVFAKVSGRIEGQEFAFESMSLMVHPTSTPLPFSAPWEAYTAISVCSVNYSPDQLLPEGLQMYYGGFTDQIAGDAPLEIHFPQTGRAHMQIVVHSYEDGRLKGTDIMSLPDGGSLTIEYDGGVSWPAWLASPPVWLGLLGMALGMLALLRARNRRIQMDVLNAQS